VLASNYANDAKTFLKHFSDCLFYFCSTCADSISVMRDMNQGNTDCSSVADLEVLSRGANPKKLFEFFKSKNNAFLSTLKY